MKYPKKFAILFGISALLVGGTILFQHTIPKSSPNHIETICYPINGESDKPDQLLNMIEHGWTVRFNNGVWYANGRRVGAAPTVKSPTCLKVREINGKAGW